ncbi:MAG: hypothetical protein ACI8UO_003569 [Verrucomicrobiales bacterium]|jgi:hypothetical protein
MLMLRSLFPIALGFGVVSALADDTGPLDRDEHTLMLLRVPADGSALRDVAGEAPVEMMGGRIVADERFGHVVQFDEDPDQSITVADEGRCDFTKGFTFEAWVNVISSEKAPNTGGGLASKRGSFVFSLSEKLGLDNDEMRFPRVPIVTTDDKQLDYFPVNNGRFYGATSIPTGQWTHLAVTYDPDREVIRTWIDGSEDRVRYLTRSEYGTMLQCDPDEPLTLLRGLKNVKLGTVRVSNIARPIGPANLLETYVHQLPYQERIVLQFAHLGSELPYPLQTSVTWENPNGPAEVIYRGTLDGPEDKFVELKGGSWNNDYYNLDIRVIAGHKELYRRSTRIANGIVRGERRIDVRPDKRIGMNGEAVFPMIMYHVFPEDFQAIADMGFHFVTPRAPDSPFLDFGRKLEVEFDNMKIALDAAEEAGIQLIMPARLSKLDAVFRFGDHPALGAWATYDEPWGVSLDKLLDTYNAVKMYDGRLPLMTAQNNLSRMSETAEGLDILACDPYPLPSVSLRMVANATKAARRAVADLKPVWTLLDQYPKKLPTLQELRCMMYLSVAAGADGIGIYAWDYRKGRGTDPLVGWRTGDSPEDLKILQSAMKEFTAIQSILVIPNSPTGFTFTDENLAVHVALKTSESKIYLVIANDSRGPQAATVSFDGIENATATNLADGTTLKIIGGILKLELDPLVSGAYQIK